jgi:hypothetical protein
MKQSILILIESSINDVPNENITNLNKEINIINNDLKKIYDYFITNYKYIKIFILYTSNNFDFNLYSCAICDKLSNYNNFLVNLQNYDISKLILYIDGHGSNDTKNYYIYDEKSNIIYDYNINNVIYNNCNKDAHVLVCIDTCYAMPMLTNFKNMLYISPASSIDQINFNDNFTYYFIKYIKSLVSGKNINHICNIIKKYNKNLTFIIA